MQEIKFTSDITVSLIDKMGGDDSIIRSAIVSTNKDMGKYTTEESKYGLINYLMKHRHGTPFEHSSVTFFVHAPIFVFREWHRHRIGFGYNEFSARYSEMEPIFWIPKRDRKLVPSDKHKSARPDFIQADDNIYYYLVENIKDSCFYAYQKYCQFLEKGVAKEVARTVLPVGIYSKMYVTCNPRSLMHFLSLRTSNEDALFRSYPQAEIEEAAKVCELIFAEGWPLTYKAFCENKRVAP